LNKTSTVFDSTLSVSQNVTKNIPTYRAFHRFGQAKVIDGGSVLGLSQFSILPQLPLKTMLGSRVVKID